MTNKGKLARSKVGQSTQKYLDIAEIKDNTVIMRDGTMRVVLMVSSINFYLKSEDEQDAIISSYVSFLNNLTFPLQVVIQSREMNIEEYLNRMKEKAHEQTNELLKMQTNEYINFIKEFVSDSKIMSKKFYIVVPYNPLSDKQKKFFSRFLETLKPARLIKMKEKYFIRRRRELTRRLDTVISGLSSVGLHAVELDTQSLIELYYNSYNPRVSANEKLTAIKDLRINK